jgi:hypothetical protein
MSFGLRHLYLDLYRIREDSLFMSGWRSTSQDPLPVPTSLSILAPCQLARNTKQVAPNTTTCACSFTTEKLLPCFLKRVPEMHAGNAASVQGKLAVSSISKHALSRPWCGNDVQCNTLQLARKRSKSCKLTVTCDLHHRQSI